MDFSIYKMENLTQDLYDVTALKTYQTKKPE